MKVLVQWARNAPSDWIEIDSVAWRGLPKRPVPDAVGGADDAPGWVNRLNVQGVHLVGDHYAVEHLAGGACRVTVWWDDPDDYPPGMFLARAWTFRRLAPDERIGGRFNTRQSQVVYAAPTILAKLIEESGGDGYENTELRPWDEFVPPAGDDTRHGVWLPDDLYVAHERAISLRGWREWTEGVPARFVRDGVVVG